MEAGRRGRLPGRPPETVAGWTRAHKAGGEKGLAAEPHPGRKPFLTADQEKQVLGWLADPPSGKSEECR